MKIEIIDENRLVIYYSLILDDILEYDIDDIKTFLQMLVLKLRKNYHLDLQGYYHLDVYVKKILILEFQKMDDYENEIDLNIVVHPNTPIVVGFSDYFLMPGKKYYYENQYYLPIEQVDYAKYLEFIQFFYNDEAKKILSLGRLV